jgi:hypothetical protein
MLRPAFNFEPNYRVMILTKEEWTRGTGTPAAVRLRLIWFTEGTRMKEGSGAVWGLWAIICVQKAQYFCGKLS